MNPERDLTYITAHFIELEMNHLARMIHSTHWHRSRAWTPSYWRQRIEQLRHAPLVSDVQHMELDLLLLDLERIAMRLDQPVRAVESAAAQGSEAHQ
jgi:hypothetical protein